jgi:SAM-dependent methyltransferase
MTSSLVRDAVTCELNASEPGWLDDSSIISWAFSQTNAALRRERDAFVAEKILRTAKLPLHPDPVKNWDTCLALVHACTATTPGAAILDAGAERYSPFLPALNELGFADLTGINITFGQPEFVAGATLRHGDITRTDFPTGHFGFIACLSVIEHGVDIGAFLAEASRLLQPNGTLFLSFDYWQHEVDTRGQHAYGVPIRIFTRDDALQMIATAAGVGLELETPADLTCENRVVHWERFDLRYTFGNLVFRAASR